MVVTLAHQSTAAYRETYDLLHRRAASRLNDSWQADHTPLDIGVRDGEGKPMRPGLTVSIDDSSRAGVSYRHQPAAPRRPQPHR